MYVKHVGVGVGVGGWDEISEYNNGSEREQFEQDGYC